MGLDSSLLMKHFSIFFFLFSYDVWPGERDFYLINSMHCVHCGHTGFPIHCTHVLSSMEDYVLTGTQRSSAQARLQIALVSNISGVICHFQVRKGHSSVQFNLFFFVISLLISNLDQYHHIIIRLYEVNRSLDPSVLFCSYSILSPGPEQTSGAQRS